MYLLEKYFIALFIVKLTIGGKKIVEYKFTYLFFAKFSCVLDCYGSSLSIILVLVLDNSRPVKTLL